MTDDEKRTCLHKRPYKTREDAEKAIELKIQSPTYQPRKGETLHAYECPYCYRWHKGNTKPR